MIRCFDKGVFLQNGRLTDDAGLPTEQRRKSTMAWQILQAHNTSCEKKPSAFKSKLNLPFLVKILSAIPLY